MRAQNYRIKKKKEKKLYTFALATSRGCVIASRNPSPPMGSGTCKPQLVPAAGTCASDSLKSISFYFNVTLQCRLCKEKKKTAPENSLHFNLQPYEYIPSAVINNMKLRHQIVIFVPQILLQCLRILKFNPLQILPNV